MVRSVEGKHPNYYEAILQLRNVKEDVTNFVKQEISKHNIPVAKVVKAKNGQDYYLADNDFTKAVGKKLQQKFGGELKVTATLFSKKDGKDIYRVTVLFRQAEFKKGDLVEYQGEEHIAEIMGKEIVLQNTKTSKKERVKYKDMKRIKQVQ